MTRQETPHPEQHLDEWHQHGPEEGAPQQEHTSSINTPILLVAFVAMAVTVGVLVIAVTLFYNSTKAQLSAVRLENTAGYSEEYVPYRQAAKEQINGFHADDVDAGTVRIPVEQAFESVIDQYAGQ